MADWCQRLMKTEGCSELGLWYDAPRIKHHWATAVLSTSYPTCHFRLYISMQENFPRGFSSPDFFDIHPVTFIPTISLSLFLQQATHNEKCSPPRPSPALRSRASPHNPPPRSHRGGKEGGRKVGFPVSGPFLVPTTAASLVHPFAC